MVHDRLPFRRRRRPRGRRGALARRPRSSCVTSRILHVTCVEINEAQIAEAERYARVDPLGARPRQAALRPAQKMDATKLDFEAESFDAAFLCWILEHVGEPARVLSEVRRVLQPGAPIVCTEVLNATFFLEPYSPETLRYWMAFNDHQPSSVGGDLFSRRQARQPAAVGRLPRRRHRGEDLPSRQPSARFSERARRCSRTGATSSSRAPRPCSPRTRSPTSWFRRDDDASSNGLRGTPTPSSSIRSFRPAPAPGDGPREFQQCSRAVGARLRSFPSRGRALAGRPSRD